VVVLPWRPLAQIKHGKKPRDVKRRKTRRHWQWQPSKPRPVSDEALNKAFQPAPFRAPATGILTDASRLIPLFRERFRSRPFKFFRKLFTQFDTDHSGAISEEEMATGMRAIFPGITDKQAHEFFEAVKAYEPGSPPSKKVPGGKKISTEFSGISKRVNWWPSYIAAEKGAATRGSQQSSRASGKWPPASAPETRGDSGSGDEDDVAFEQFFEFLLHRKEQGDVFDPWMVEYERCVWPSETGELLVSTTCDTEVWHVVCSSCARDSLQR